MKISLLTLFLFLLALGHSIAGDDLSRLIADPRSNLDDLYHAARSAYRDDQYLDAFKGFIVFRERAASKLAQNRSAADEIDRVIRDCEERLQTAYRAYRESKMTGSKAQ